jgi:hypothetical protein
MFRSRRTLPAAVSPIFEPSNLQACQPALRPPLRSQLRAKCEIISPLFSHSSALFCHGQTAKPFIFRRFRTLSQKHPGWGTLRLLSTPDPCTDSQKQAPASPLLATLTKTLGSTPPSQKFPFAPPLAAGSAPTRHIGQCRFGTYWPSVHLTSTTPLSIRLLGARGLLGPRRGRCYAIDS